MSIPILKLPAPSPLRPRVDIIRWIDDSDLYVNSMMEPPLATWLVDAALDGKRRKPARVVWRLIQGIAPTFDMSPRQAFIEALIMPWGTHGIEYRPPANTAALWRRYGLPDSVIWFQGEWVHRYGAHTETVGRRFGPDMHLPSTPGVDE